MSIVCVSRGGGAENGYREPPAIHPSTVALAAVLAKVAASEGDLGGGRIERYQVERGTVGKGNAGVTGETHAQFD